MWEGLMLVTFGERSRRANAATGLKCGISVFALAAMTAPVIAQTTPVTASTIRIARASRIKAAWCQSRNGLKNSPKRNKFNALHEKHTPPRMR